MAYVLTVNWIAKEGHEAKIHEILRILGEASRQEPDEEVKGSVKGS